MMRYELTDYEWAAIRDCYGPCTTFRPVAKKAGAEQIMDALAAAS